MSATSALPQLVIDARPRHDGGLYADVVLLGKPVLTHLVESAHRAGVFTIAIRGDVADRGRLRRLLDAQSCPGCRLVEEALPPEVPTLRTDCLYAPRRLRRALRGRQSMDRAVLWRLDSPEGLAGAESELRRRLTYQPIGQYWAYRPACALARILRPTRVRPNAVTLGAAALMGLAAGLVAWAGPGLVVRVLVALALALALVLDTADGHLARLQGTASEFGRWLDEWLDEAADMALHAAIAWQAFARTGQSQWLVLGMAFGMGKYLYRIATEPGKSATPRAELATPEAPSRPGWLTWLVRTMGHADIRWHVWIALALLGTLEVELLMFAVYFPVRAVAGVVRKGVRRG